MLRKVKTKANLSKSITKIRKIVLPKKRVRNDECRDIEEGEHRASGRLPKLNDDMDDVKSSFLKLSNTV